MTTISSGRQATEAQPFRAGRRSVVAPHRHPHVSDSTQATNLGAPFCGGTTLSATATMLAASNAGRPGSTDDAAFERVRHAARQIRSVRRVEEATCRDGQAIAARLIAAPSVLWSKRAKRFVGAMCAMFSHDRMRVVVAGDAFLPRES